MNATTPPTATDVRLALREYYAAKALSDAAMAGQLELERATNEKERRIKALLEECQSPGENLTAYPPEDFFARQLADLFSIEAPESVPQGS